MSVRGNKNGIIRTDRPLMSVALCNFLSSTYLCKIPAAAGMVEEADTEEETEEWREGGKSQSVF